MAADALGGIHLRTARDGIHPEGLVAAVGAGDDAAAAAEAAGALEPGIDAGVAVEVGRKAEFGKP